MEKGCPSIDSQKKDRSTTPKGRGNAKVSEKKKATVAIVNVAKSLPED